MPLVDALRVVEPVDAEQHELGIAEVAADLARPLDHRSGRQRVPVMCAVSIEIGNAPTRTMRPSCCRPPSAVVASVSRRASREKFDAAPGNLEADEVGAEQSLEDLAPPRQLHEELLRRERDVEEEADRHVGAQRAQHHRHELQVVVVHPDRRARRRPPPRPPPRSGGSPARTTATSGGRSSACGSRRGTAATASGSRSRGRSPRTRRR